MKALQDENGKIIWTESGYGRKVEGLLWKIDTDEELPKNVDLQ